MVSHMLESKCAWAQSHLKFRICLQANGSGPSKIVSLTLYQAIKKDLPIFKTSPYVHTLSSLKMFNPAYIWRD